MFACCVPRYIVNSIHLYIRSHNANEQDMNTMQQPIRSNLQFSCRMNPSPSKILKQLSNDSPRSSYPDKKQLRFADTSTLIFTVQKTSGENNATWYTKDDIAQFKKAAKDSAALLANEEESKVLKLLGYSAQEGLTMPKLKLRDSTSIRGLEHMASKDVAKVLCKSQRCTIYRVIEEQTRQSSSGTYDAEQIAAVSQKSSRFAVVYRQLIAMV